MRRETTKIIIWPDNEWEYLDDYRPEDYLHRSDDTAVVSIPTHLEWEEIDYLVQAFNRGEAWTWTAS